MTGAIGDVPSNRVALPIEATKPRNVFEGITTELTDYEREWILKNWGIEDPPYWYHTPEYGGRIAMSIRSPRYLHRGWVLRDINGTARTKALTYVDANEESLSWYKEHAHAPCVVVEDIPSAVRASRYVNAVALCGTRLGLTRAIEIAENAKNGVWIALDQDATEQAFQHALRYSLLLGDVEVLPLKKDIKDMPEDDIMKLLR